MAVVECAKLVPAASPRRRAARWRALAPAATFLGVRVAGVGVLALLCVFNNYGLLDRLTAWDGQWYLRIAAGGYSLGFFDDAHGQPNQYTPRAFFPGYPLATRALSRVSGLNLTAAALLVSTGCGLAAAYGLARLGRLVRNGSPRAGTILVALVAAAPMGIALSMAYSEAMFCALAAWGLVGVLERRWWVAGGCTALAGLVRSTALALVVAVALAALVVAIRRRDARPLAAVVLAPTGLLGYLWWTGQQVRPHADLLAQLWTWPDLEWQGWLTRFDGGAQTIEFVWQVLIGHEGTMSVLTVGVILGAVVLFAVGVRARLEWPLVVYGAVVLVMTLGSSGLMHSKPRLLLPAAVILLIPPAVELARRRVSTVVPLLIGLALVGGWFGAYALTVWKYAV